MATIKFNSNEKLIFLDIGVISSDGSWIIYLPVVLDTGATTTILPADILADLGYDPGCPGLSRIRMITGSGIEYAPSITVALTKRRPLKGYDAIQLASALHLNAEILSEKDISVVFLCADDILCNAAKSEGLQTINPNDYG